MKRQTTEKKLATLLKVANHPLCYWLATEVRRRGKDVVIILQAARRCPDIHDLLPIDFTVEMSVKALIEKRYPARKKAKATRRTK
jgi:hypothetical protein